MNTFIKSTPVFVYIRMRALDALCCFLLNIRKTFLPAHKTQIVLIGPVRDFRILQIQVNSESF